MSKGTPIEHGEQASVDLARVYLTVVHGTWAHGFFRSKPGESATWFAESGKFSQSLKSRIEEEGVRCEIKEPCIWTGGNSMAARRRCTLQLRKAQRASALADPDAIRIIVAHSHGGTAAIRAFASLGQKYKPHGLVTLSTPFVVSEVRELNASEKLLIRAASGVWTLLSFAACMALALILIKLSMPMWILEKLGSFTELIFFGLTLAVAGLARPAVLRVGKMRDRFTRIALRASETMVDGSRLLAVRAPGDEASLALATGDAVELANGFARRMLETPVKLVGFVREQDWYKYLVYAAMSLFLSSVIAVFLMWFMQVWIDVPDFLAEPLIYAAFYAGALVACFVGLCVAVAVAMGVIAIASLSISSLFSVGYGPEYPFLGWRLRTTAESSPIGVSTTCHSLRLKDMSGLRHGIYRSEEACVLIANWIVARARSQWRENKGGIGPVDGA